jgi:hypothetical protein
MAKPTQRVDDSEHWFQGPIPVDSCTPKEDPECFIEWLENPIEGSRDCVPEEGLRTCPPSGAYGSTPYQIISGDGYFEVAGEIVVCPSRGDGPVTQGSLTTVVRSGPVPDQLIAELVKIRLLEEHASFPGSGIFNETVLNQDIQWAAYRGVTDGFGQFGRETRRCFFATFQNWSHNRDRRASINLVMRLKVPL